MNTTTRGLLSLGLWSMFAVGLFACGVGEQDGDECCEAKALEVQRRSMCSVDADCDSEPQPGDGGAVTLSRYDAAVRNSAAESRTCVLQVLHNGVRKDLFHGILSPGETVTFPAAVMAVAPFYVETTAGCEGGPPSNTGLSPVYTYKNTFFQSTGCRVTYYETSALHQTCWYL